jgi:orotidine-5'-phosphate decarboxylase
VRQLGDWLESTSRKANSRIIFAADVDGPYGTRVERAARLVSLLGESIVAVKVNWHLLLPSGVLGLGTLGDACRSKGLPLIADVKLNDIGVTNVEAADTLFSNGFDALIANPFVGYRDGIQDLLVKSHRMGKGVILLVYMSHAGAKEGYGMKVGGRPLYTIFARRAKEWGADGIVVSAKSPSVIKSVRSLVGDDMLMMSPGVGVQGGDAKRAVKAGSDYVIVGRTLIGAKDPVATADDMNRGLGALRG